jgi:hypothetical protein
MRQHIFARTAERLQRRPWLEVLESRLTPSQLLHGRPALAPPLEQSLHAIAAPGERASAAAESNQAVSRSAETSSRLADGLGIGGKDTGGANEAIGAGPGISVAIQTDEVSVTFTRGALVALDSQTTESARPTPSVSGRSPALSSEPLSASAAVSAPITVLFVVTEPRLELRFFTFTPTSIVSSNVASPTADSAQTTSSSADLSTTPAATPRPSALTNISLTPSAAANPVASSVATAAANTAAINFGDAAFRLLTVAARPSSLDRAFQSSGDNSAAARNASLIPAPFSDPTRTITTPASPPQRLPSGGGGDEPAKGAEATPPVTPPIVTSGDGQNPEAIVGAEGQQPAEKPAALGTTVSRIVAGSVAGAAVAYLALSSYGRGMMRKWKARRLRKPTLTP